MAYLRNTWYAIAFGGDVSQTPFARTLLDVPVVLFRRADGTIVAMRDRCPHRFVPLSRGKVKGDTLVCGYHGLRIDASGACVDNRFNEATRNACAVPMFPIVEQDGFVWIWMGDAGIADPALVPDFGHMEVPGRQVVRHTTYVKANYQLEVDNLMDLSHLDYVHLATIGNGQLSTGTHTVEQNGDVVHSAWWSPHIDMPMQWRAECQTPDWKCDNWTDMAWSAPSTIKLEVGVCPPGEERHTGSKVLQAHLLTPETEHTTWYLWAISFVDMGQDDESWARTKAFVRHAFEQEDLPLIEAAQTAMGANDFWAERPVIFPEDAAAIRVRRLMSKLIRQEGDLSPHVEDAAQ